MTHLGPAAPAGLHCYLGGQFGDEYLENLFAANFNLSKVTRHIPKEKGSTYETVTLGAGMAARLEGKSSLGRLGLLTHSTAGFIDPGFSGHVTLELSNMATLPIALWPGMRIGQLCFFRLSSPAEHPYGSGDGRSNRYQGQRGPTASRSWQSFHRTEV